MSQRKENFSISENHLRPVLWDLNWKGEEPIPADEGFSESMSNYIEMTKYQDSLRRFVDSWIAANYDYQSWGEKNSSMKEQVEKLLESVSVRLVSEVSGRAKLIQVIPPSIFDANRSLDGFIKIITSSLFDRIGKCNRCKNYYLASTAHESKYCSRSCATGATAVESTRKRLKRERDNKINRVRKAIQDFKARKVKSSDWKEWVANRARVTPKWITRAYNKGELKNAKELVEKKGRK